MKCEIRNYGFDCIGCLECVNGLWDNVEDKMLCKLPYHEAVNPDLNAAYALVCNDFKSEVKDED